MIPMLAFTPLESTRGQLSLTWGIRPFLAPAVSHTDQMAMQVDDALLGSGRCAEGEIVVIVAGSPPGIPGSTNGLRVHHVGDAKNKVAPAYEDLD
jgi:pyruvate kinase